MSRWSMSFVFVMFLQSLNVNFKNEMSYVYWYVTSGREKKAIA